MGQAKRLARLNVVWYLTFPRSPSTSGKVPSHLQFVPTFLSLLVCYLDVKTVDQLEHSPIPIGTLCNMQFNTILVLTGLLALTSATPQSPEYVMSKPHPTPSPHPCKYFQREKAHDQNHGSKQITKCLLNNRQSTAAANALISYLEDLSTNTAFLSAISAIETDSAAVSSLSAFEASVSSVFENQETLATDYLNGVPETVRPFFSSVYQAEASILTANGFSNPLKSVSATATSSGTGTGTATGAAQATSSSTAGAAARETGLGRVGQVAVAGAVGFVGVVMAL